MRHVWPTTGKALQ